MTVFDEDDDAPEIEYFNLTATEVAEGDEDLVYEYMKRHEFRLASMCSRVREAMLDAIVEEEGIRGGWFFRRPHDCMEGPYPTRQDAEKEAGNVV